MTKVKEAVGSGDDFFKVVMLSKKGKRMLEQIIGQVLGKEVVVKKCELCYTRKYFSSLAMS